MSAYRESAGVPIRLADELLREAKRTKEREQHAARERTAMMMDKFRAGLWERARRGEMHMIAERLFALVDGPIDHKYLIAELAKEGIRYVEPDLGAFDILCAPVVPRPYFTWGEP